MLKRSSCILCILVVACFLLGCKAVRAAELVAVVDRDAQTVLVYANHAELHGPWPVSTARAPYRTPSGTYRATWMDADHRSKIYDDAPMPFSVFYDGGRALHGIEGGEARLLGRAASHGCVRMSVAHARAFYDLVRKYGLKNTFVIIQ